MDEPVETDEVPSVDDAPVEPELASVEGVTRLKDLVGNYAMALYRDDVSRYVRVDTEDGHNPYDLVWRYGPDYVHLTGYDRPGYKSGWYRDPGTGEPELVRRPWDEVEKPEWDALYRSYVDACDWSLVFDADYYKKAFPMLAKLYHENDALLLEHFQTQGVHEGRQGSERFNVAAYMENCGKDLVKAFGDAYECYYFYYMLDQDTQTDVPVANEGGRYPRWLTVELSLQQECEYKSVARYRQEAGVDPVELDPETMAFANYRAWHDAEYNVHAHDWITDPATADDVDDCLARTCNDHFAENTVKWQSTNGASGYSHFAGYYASSGSHYKAMVNGNYHYAGYSNPYWSDNPDNPFADENGQTGFVCQFDLFSEAACRSPYMAD